MRLDKRVGFCGVAVGEKVFFMRGEIYGIIMEKRMMHSRDTASCCRMPEFSRLKKNRTLILVQ